jgi:hypothetical protein
MYIKISSNGVIETVLGVRKYRKYPRIRNPELRTELRIWIREAS